MIKLFSYPIAPLHKPTLAHKFRSNITLAPTDKWSTGYKSPNSFVLNFAALEELWTTFIVYTDLFNDINIE